MDKLTELIKPKDKKTFALFCIMTAIYLIGMIYIRTLTDDILYNIVNWIIIHLLGGIFTFIVVWDYLDRLFLWTDFTTNATCMTFEDHCTFIAIIDIIITPFLTFITFLFIEIFFYVI